MVWKEESLSESENLNSRYVLYFSLFSLTSHTSFYQNWHTVLFWKHQIKTLCLEVSRLWNASSDTNLKELLLPNGTYTDQLYACGCHWDFLQVKKVCTSRESYYEGKAHQCKSLQLLIFRKVKDWAFLIMMTNTNFESPHLTKLLQVFFAAFTSGSSYSF